MRLSPTRRRSSLASCRSAALLRATACTRYHGRYRECMAMTLRLTDEESAALRAYAEAHGTSMQEAAREAVRQLVGNERRKHFIERILTEDAQLLHRLSQ
jgi:plasmid stability protein